MHLICVQIFFLKIYKNEYSKAKPEWHSFLDFLNQIFIKVQDENLKYISAFCVKYKIMILVGEFKNAFSAIKEVEEFISFNALSDIEKFLVLDEIGQQLFYSGDKKQSINYLKHAAELQVPLFFTEKAECYLILNQLYDDIDKLIADKYIIQAYNYQNENSFINEIFSFKIIGEYALSLWEKGNTTKGFYILEEGLCKILSSYRPIGDYQAIVVRYSHVLNYYYHKLINKELPKPDGEEYVKPFRGIFLRSNDALLGSGFYFEQRKFMVAYLMVNIFESIGDIKSASNWFEECVRLNSDDDQNIFSVLMIGMQNYLILQNKFDETASWLVKYFVQISNLKSNPKISSIDINIQNQKYIYSLYKNYEKDLDGFLYEFVVVYSLIKILWDYLKTNDEWQLKKSVSNLDKLSQYFLNTSNYLKVYSLILDLTTFLLDKTKSTNDILELLPTNQEDPWLKVIVYLFASVNSRAKDSIEIHFLFIKYLTLLASKFPNSSANYFLITPFFVDFWKFKFESKTSDFVFGKHLAEKGFPSIDSSKVHIRLKKLYRVICYHLEYEPTEDINSWLSSD